MLVPKLELGNQLKRSASIGTETDAPRASAHPMENRAYKVIEMLLSVFICGKKLLIN